MIEKIMTTLEELVKAVSNFFSYQMICHNSRKHRFELLRTFKLQADKVL